MTATAEELRKVSLKVINSEEVTVVTAGTPVQPSSNTNAVAVLVQNNNPSLLVLCGMVAAEVDALAAPVKGTPLWYGDSRLFYVTDNASDVYIDADTDGTKVTVDIYGR